MKKFKQFIQESVVNEVSKTPTRFVTIDDIPKEMIPYAKDPRYIIMNAPRPILGEYEIQSTGPIGTYFAAVKINDSEDSKFHAEQNNKAKATILYPLTQNDLESIAVGDSKYRNKILSNNVKSSIESAIQKMKDVPYREALQMVKKFASENKYI